MYNTNHEFTNNEREISIPHEAVECGIENFTLTTVPYNTVATPLKHCYDSVTIHLQHR